MYLLHLRKTFTFRVLCVVLIHAQCGCVVCLESSTFNVVFTRQANLASSEELKNFNSKVIIKRATEQYLLLKVARIENRDSLFINLTKSVHLQRTDTDSDVKSFESEEPSEYCFYGRGLVYDSNTFSVVANSWAALTVCRDVVEGFVLLENVGFTLEVAAPAGRSKRNADHLSNETRIRSKRSFFNLTGDTFDSPRTDWDSEHNGNHSPASAPENLQASLEHQHNVPFYVRDQNANVTRTNYENWLTQQSDEELGYFYDSAWKSVSTVSSRHKALGRNPQRFLEIVIAVDDSVIKFHGRIRVKQYVLTLMNIVNALYQDPSLEANLHISIRELHLYEKKRNVIRLGNAKKSLENVNLWNKDLHLLYDDDDDPHDIALWLTRTDIGGPSGYAPVGGVCDAERSCALTRDEGLTCAFIIAHELAHILGLSHDGDAKNNNTCRDEARRGSVMAPMVSATFHHFLWSDCSRREFAAKVSQWQCLLNTPDATRSIELNATLGARFTMDEQCRVEFGEGYELCRSFDIVEPCAHLWCGHVNSPLVCKTKKGPPLEGTECGIHKWCIDGYCDSTLRMNLDPLKYNPQDGGWSDWGPWTFCSRSCGLGMQFRPRTCDNPRPAYGGVDCEGLPEEWRVCNVQDCPEKKDFRAQQCTRMPKLLNVPKNMTWLPYESNQMEFKCKYICQSKETGEIYASEEFLTDGTLCSYDWDNKRCVQGKCVMIGCDNHVNSTLIQDGCGVCNGNNLECLRIKSNVTKKIKKQITRLGVLHNQARHIAIEFALHRDNPGAAPQIDYDLFLKDRKRNAFRIRKSPFGRFGSSATWESNQRENNAHPNDVPMAGRDGSGIAMTIVHGAKFRFHAAETTNALLPHNETNETLYLSTLGPVLNELVLFIEIKNFKSNNVAVGGFGVKLRMGMEYLLHRRFKETRYEWILGGWGSCSTSCGGGRMFKTKACVEKATQRIVARKLCSIVNKPPTEVKLCNDFSCNFVWIPGEWEPCSATCGQDGVQHREVYCVPQNLQNTTNDIQTAPWKYMLPPTKCGYQPPSITRPCNRTTCPGHWEYSPWSSCSTSCGLGEQVRVAQCHGNDINMKMRNLHSLTIPDIVCDAEYSGIQQFQICESPATNQGQCEIENCAGDTSPFCSMQALQRYCNIEEFRNLCCASCYQHENVSSIQI